MSWIELQNAPLISKQTSALYLILIQFDDVIFQTGFNLIQFYLYSLVPENPIRRSLMSRIWRKREGKNPF